MHILVDARKAFDSGIGTYIRGVVPGVMNRLHDHAFTVLMKAGYPPPFGNALRPGITYMAVEDAPFGLREQWGLRRAQHTDPPVDAFWVTSLAHPLWTRAPLIATIHDVVQLVPQAGRGGGLPVRAAARVFLQSLRSHADLLMFNSDFTRSEFERCVGTSRGRQVVTPLGVASDWFSRREKPPAAARPYFLCVTSWRAHKNLAFLLAAFAAVHRQVPHELVIVGADASRADAQCASLGDRIRWLGSLSDEALKGVVSSANAMVLPSLYEGFGLPALEAMAAGCPVLASRIGAFVEVCGDAADYFDPHDQQSLIAALADQAARDPEQVDALRRRGIERARRFTWERTVDLTSEAIASFPTLRTSERR